MHFSTAAIIIAAVVSAFLFFAMPLQSQGLIKINEKKNQNNNQVIRTETECKSEQMFSL